MTASFFVVPQWQGSGSSRAMRLVDGATAIRDDLPVSATITVAVPGEAGSDLGSGVHRLGAVATVQGALWDALGSATGTPVVIGGDCGVELAAIEHALGAAATSGDLAVVWIDAHADLNTPESSPSGSFSGMVLRTLLGDGPEAVTVTGTLDPSKVILAGVRAVDDAESDFIAASGLTHLLPEQLTAESLTRAIAATGATRVYLHVDLDVLDPAEFSCVGLPEPFGVSLAGLLELIAATKLALPIAGAGITGFAPSSPDAASEDLPTILRIIGAITRTAPQPSQP